MVRVMRGRLRELVGISEGLGGRWSGLEGDRGSRDGWSGLEGDRGSRDGWSGNNEGLE